MNVGRIAGDGQDLGPGALQPARHFGQDRPWPREGIIAVRNLGIDIDNHPDVVLIPLHGGKGLQLAQKIESGGGPHAAKDPEYAAHSRCSSRWDAWLAGPWNPAAFG